MKRGIGPGVCQPVDGADDDERQNAIDRRSGRDRRHSGERAEPSSEPRSYGFRDFEPRRDNQDRRLYGIDGGRMSGDEPPGAPANDTAEPQTAADDPVDGLLPLTPDQLRWLLRKDGR